MQRDPISQLTGLDELSAFLSATGRGGRIADRAEFSWLDQGPFAADRRLAVVESSPIDLVSVRIQGVVGPRQLLASGAFSLRVGGLPVAGNMVLPTQTHLLLRRPGVHSGLQASLVQQRQGFFSRTRVGLGWRGRDLAVALQADAELASALMQHLDVDDDLVVNPDPARQLVRIILKRSTQLRWGLFADPGKLGSFHRRDLAGDLFACLERIAEHVRAA